MMLDNAGVFLHLKSRITGKVYLNAGVLRDDIWMSQENLLAVAVDRRTGEELRAAVALGAEVLQLILNGPVDALRCFRVGTEHAAARECCGGWIQEVRGEQLLLWVDDQRGGVLAGLFSLEQLRRYAELLRPPTAEGLHGSSVASVLVEYLADHICYFSLDPDEDGGSAPISNEGLRRRLANRNSAGPATPKAETAAVVPGAPVTAGACVE